MHYNQCRSTLATVGSKIIFHYDILFYMTFQIRTKKAYLTPS